jgi:hypothetical protein
MRRGTQSRLILASGIALLLVAAPAAQTATAAPAAVEEYVLTLPGVKTSGIGQSSPADGPAGRVGPVGVTGERRPAPSVLAGIGAAAASPGGFVLALALAAAVALALRRTRDPR